MLVGEHSHGAECGLSASRRLVGDNWCASRLAFLRGAELVTAKEAVRLYDRMVRRGRPAAGDTADAASPGSRFLQPIG